MRVYARTASGCCSACATHSLINKAEAMSDELFVMRTCDVARREFDGRSAPVILPYKSNIDGA